jgi:NAD(P)H dehydrogenase (quinone)
MEDTSDVTPNAGKTARFQHLLVHANPSSDSFGRAIVDAYADTVRSCGQDVVVRDLYAMKFDPVLQAHERPGSDHWAPAPDVAPELDLVNAADILVLVYPIWFGLPPAILKGYVDRVLGANYSFREFTSQAGRPGLAGKPLLSFSTSGAPLSWLNEQGQALSLREIFDVYLWRGFCMKQSEHVMIESVVPNMSPAYAAEQLQRVRDVATRTCSNLMGTSVERAGFES